MKRRGGKITSGPASLLVLMFFFTALNSSIGNRLWSIATFWNICFTLSSLLSAENSASRKLLKWWYQPRLRVSNLLCNYVFCHWKLFRQRLRVVHCQLYQGTLFQAFFLLTFSFSPLPAFFGNLLVEFILFLEISLLASITRGSFDTFALFFLLILGIWFLAVSLLAEIRVGREVFYINLSFASWWPFKFLIVAFFSWKSIFVAIDILRWPPDSLCL